MGTKLRWTALVCVAGLIVSSSGCDRTARMEEPAVQGEGLADADYVLSRNDTLSNRLQCAATVPVDSITLPIDGRAGGPVRLPDRGEGVSFPRDALNPPPRTVRVVRVPRPDVGLRMHVTPAAPKFSRPSMVFLSLEGCTDAELNTTVWSVFRVDSLTASSGDRLVTGRFGDVLWALADGNSFFIVAD
jgi:hypothetical protein